MLVSGANIISVLYIGTWSSSAFSFLFFKEVNTGDSAPSMVKRGRDTFLQEVFPDYALPESGILCLVAEVLLLPKIVV